MFEAVVFRRHLTWLAAIVMVAGCTGSTTAKASPRPSASATVQLPAPVASQPVLTQSANASATKRPLQEGPDGPHLPADIAYVEQFSTHHRTSIALADMAIARTGNEQIKIVAQYIRQEQLSELSPMVSWLAVWTSPASTTGTTRTSTASVTSPIPAEVISGRDLQQLSESTGRSFDELFLRLMIRSHRSSWRCRDGNSSRARAPQC